MRYYTKEWYELMQKLHYMDGLEVIPDKVYSDLEIQAFYDADLAREVEHDRLLHETPPDFSLYDSLLDSAAFRPDMFLFMDAETGETYYPATLEIARAQIERVRTAQEEAFAKRPPFDPTDTIRCFAECYKGMLRYGGNGYPQWVRDTVDMRLLALHRIPQTAYDRLRAEETVNQKAFDDIMREAEAVLSKQDIPERIQSQLCFHDATLLALKKNGPDVELTLRKDGDWPEGTPYCKMIFKQVSNMEREKGFALRMKRDDEGEWTSSCHYLYDELYRTEDGYALHMLLAAPKALRYLTVYCEDIIFVDNIQAPVGK